MAGGPLPERPCRRRRRRDRERRAWERPAAVELSVVIPGCASELGFTRVRQYYCPSRQQPTWMRRPGIHTHDGGYGLRARSLLLAPRNDTTTWFPLWNPPPRCALLRSGEVLVDMRRSPPSGEHT